jgi:hypothetical protein
MRIRSVHPGVSVEDVVAATGFELDAGHVSTTRTPTALELEIIRSLDPRSSRDKELPG